MRGQGNHHDWICVPVCVGMCVFVRVLLTQRNNPQIYFQKIQIGSSWGGDAPDVGEEPKNQTEAKPVVLGRGTASQHSQHTSRYFDYLLLNVPVLWYFDISSPECLKVSLQCKYVCLPLRVSIVLPCLHWKLFRSPALCCYCWLTPCSASPSLFLPYFQPLLLPLPCPCSRISLFLLSALCLSAIVLSPPGPGFVESAFLYPLDLAGLEHMQSAFSLYRRYGMTSQCEYCSTVSLSQPVLDRWL